jgi:hypothetical protein
MSTNCLDTAFTVELPSYCFIYQGELNLSTHFKRLQFSFRLAFSINKSQGQTFQVGLNLEKQVFGHGTLYVGLSRATTREGVRIYQPLSKRIQSKPDDPSGM